MKRSVLSIVIFGLLFSSSCIDKEQCVKDYLAADKWFVERSNLAGDNPEALKAIQDEYQRKYREIDAKCK